MASVDVLIPTCNRPEALALALLSLTTQTYGDFRIVIADQSDRDDTSSTPPLSTVLALLQLHNHQVVWLRNMPRRGMAQQRQILIEHAGADYCLMLDDDVILEPFVLGMLVAVLSQERCGFVGQGLIGLSYQDDVRPHEQQIELWKGSVEPEHILPDSFQWQRYKLHNAANLLHVQRKLGATSTHPLLYKLAWSGGCVLYDRHKLLAVGAFSFWRDLPKEHAGEDVLAQLRVMQRFGACGVLPSGAYHQELPTTIHNRKVDAPRWLTV